MNSTYFGLLAEFGVKEAWQCQLPKVDAQPMGRGVQSLCLVLTIALEANEAVLSHLLEGEFDETLDGGRGRALRFRVNGG